MASLSDYLEDALLDHVLSNTGYTSPTTVYLALFSDATADDGTGTEATGGSYARQAVAFDAAANGLAANSGAITFSSMPAGTWTHAAIYDASSGGNMLLHAALSSSQTTGAGDAVNFNPGDIVVTLD